MTVLGDSDPVIASDGAWLAFRRAVSAVTSEIYLQSLSAGFMASGEPQKLRSFCGAVTLASIPGESSIIFSSGPAMSDYLRLWRMPIPGSSPAPIRLSGAQGGVFPSMAKSGRLVFQKSHTEIGVWRVDLSTPTRAAGPPQRAYNLSPLRGDHSVQFSPDGSRIVFSSNRSGANEIWTADVEGRNAEQLTELRAFSGSPRWSPDGQWIAFDSNKDCAWHVYTIPAIGGKPRRLILGSSGEDSPTWSPNGKSIYYAAGPKGGGYNIWSIPFEGGVPHQVTTEGAHRSVVSIDGKTLYYTRGDRETLWLSPVAVRQPTKLGDFSINNSEFVLGHEGIYFLDTTGTETGASLKYLDLGSRVVTTIMQISRRPAQGLSLSPNGRTLLWSQVERDSSDLMFADNIR